MKIAILGGTFDPIHNGHIRAARTVARAFAVDEVHFVPAFTPPHKSRTGLTSPFHRFAMVALAIMEFDGFRVSTIEVDRLESRYTVDTLALMHERHPGAAFLLITGADLYAEIEEWKSHDRLFDLASVAVVHRPGFSMRDDVRSVEVVRDRPEQPLSTTPRVYYLPHVDEDVSSTTVRQRLRNGTDVEEWIPPAVQTYITSNRLYS